MNKIAPVTRRSFMRGILAAAPAPAIIPSHVLGAEAPSNKITLGVIGVGAQGTQDMVHFLGLKEEVRVTAICDIESAVRSDTLCQTALIAVKQDRKL